MFDKSWASECRFAYPRVALSQAHKRAKAQQEMQAKQQQATAGGGGGIGSMFGF
jgi:hypothetical protein